MIKCLYLFLIQPLFRGNWQDSCKNFVGLLVYFKTPEGRFEIKCPLKKKKPGLHSLQIKRAALTFSIRSLKDLDLNECSNVNFVPKLTRTKLRQLGAIRRPQQPPQPPHHPQKKNMNVVMPFSKTNWNFKIT